MRDFLRTGACAVAAAVGSLAALQAEGGVTINSRTAQIVSGTDPTAASYFAQSTTSTGNFSASHTEGAPFTPSSPGGYAFAEQDSSVSLVADVLTVTAAGEVAGQARSQQPFASFRSEAVSSLNISFDVTGVPANYTLSGLVLSGAPSGPGTVNSGVTLTGPGPTTIESFSGITATPVVTSFNETGVLPVGTYTLNIFASRIIPPTGGNGASAAAYFDNVEFTVTPTPEPGAIAMLAIAAIPTLARRRRTT